MIKTLHILTLTAFMLGIIAPACGFAWGNNGGNNAGNAQYSLIEICGAQGIETRLVKNEDAPEAPSHIIDQCEFCFANANFIGLLMDNPNSNLYASYTAKLKHALYEDRLFTRYISHAHPRGPPSLV